MKWLAYKHLIIATLLSLLAACGSEEVMPKRAFYYWKNNKSTLDKPELDCIKNNQIQKLYVKFFEVDVDPILGMYPMAKSALTITDYSYQYSRDSIYWPAIKQLEIVPTVFVRNKVLLGANHGSLDSLASNITYLVEKYYNEKYSLAQNSFTELQIDCDWTESTRDNYFYLLRKIGRHAGKNLSCTLRLYPYKYPDKMGVPPVNKVVLMCYNLINPLGNKDENSILSNTELEKYLQGAKKYPVHIDIALPIFSWMHVYQNNQFMGLVNPKDEHITDILKPIKPLWFEVTEDKEVGNIFLRTGDRVKYEDVTPDMLRKSASLLREYIPSDSLQTVILFHLDETNFNTFNDEALHSIFTDFGK